MFAAKAVVYSLGPEKIGIKLMGSKPLLQGQSFRSDVKLAARALDGMVAGKGAGDAKN